jgi:putative transposase
LIYPTLYLDALQLKVKSQGRVVNKAIYIAFGVNLQGLKEVLGMWAAETEGAKFWMQVVTELKNRGVSDIYIACVDGLNFYRRESLNPLGRYPVLSSLLSPFRRSQQKT